MKRKLYGIIAMLMLVLSFAGGINTTYASETETSDTEEVVYLPGLLQPPAEYFEVGKESEFLAGLENTTDKVIQATVVRVVYVSGSGEVLGDVESPYENGSWSIVDVQPGEQNMFKIPVIIPDDYDFSGCIRVEMEGTDDEGTVYKSAIGVNHIATPDAEVMVESELYTDNVLKPGQSGVICWDVTNNSEYDILMDCMYLYCCNESSESETQISIYKITDNKGNVYVDDKQGGTLFYQRWDNNDEFWIEKGETVTYYLQVAIPSECKEGSYFYFTAQFSDGLDATASKATYENARMDYVPEKVVVEVKEDTPAVEIEADTNDVILSSAFTEEEQNSGKKLEAVVEVEKIDVEKVDVKDVEKIEETAGAKEIATILDISIFKKIDGVLGNNVTELTKDILITIDIPDEYLKNNRKFSVIRLHEGVTVELKDLDNDPNTITISTRLFSLYTLVYEDVETEVSTEATTEVTTEGTTELTTTEKVEEPKDESPATGDMTTVLFVFLCLASVVGMVVLDKKYN